MTQLSLILLVLSLGCGTPDSQPPAKPAEAPTVSQAAPQDTMAPAAFATSLQVYKLGVIRKGVNWTPETPAKLKEMVTKQSDAWRAAVIDGSLVGVANVIDPGEIVSVLFFRNQTDESMRAMGMNSPAAKEGLITPQIMEVWGTKGLGAGLAAKAADGKMPEAKDTLYVVYTTKGKKWSADSESPETRKATNDQIRYLSGLYASGAMKYYGVFTDMSQNMRGFGFFKAASEKEALEMMTKSPMVTSGALEAGVKRVAITQGAM